MDTNDLEKMMYEMEVHESLIQSIEMLLQLEPLRLNWELGDNETDSRHEIYNNTLYEGRQEAMPTLALLNLQLSYTALAEVIRVLGVTESGYANFAELAEQSLINVIDWVLQHLGKTEATDLFPFPVSEE